MKTKIKNLIHETKVLFHSLSAMTVTFFVMSIVLMNLLANIVFIDVPGILVLDAGIFLSWIVFLALDMVCKRYGAKAANILTVFAIIVNLLITCLFVLVAYLGCLASGIDFAAIPEGSFLLILKGDWSILFASTLAVLVSAICQNLMNVTIKKLFAKKHNDKKFTSYAVASYISTAIGQFVDNLVFGVFLYLVIFAQWGMAYTFPQVLGQAFIAMLVELVCEVVFSPLGYKVARKWEDEGRGQDYLDLLEANKV